MSLEKWARTQTKTADELIEEALHSPEVKESVRPLIESQLDSHVDGVGNELGYTDSRGRFRTRYSKATEIITRGRKKAGERFNLKDSGRFRTSIKGKAITDGLEVVADTVKGSEDLLNKFGKGIIEISTENKGEMARQKVLPALSKQIRRGLL